MARWEQVGGDVNPKEYGAVLVRVEGSSVTVVQIDPGEEEGEGFYVTEGHFDESDLKWGGQAKFDGPKPTGCSQALFETNRLGQTQASCQTQEDAIRI